MFNVIASLQLVFVDSIHCKYHKVNDCDNKFADVLINMRGKKLHEELIKKLNSSGIGPGRCPISGAAIRYANPRLLLRKGFAFAIRRW